MADAFFQAMRGVGQALDISALRSTVIQNNIANVDTPGFKRSYIPFESVMRETMATQGFTGRKTRAGHREIGDGEGTGYTGIIRDEDTMMRIDENNVDIETEMTELARNQLYYDALIQKLNGQFSRLRAAITETR